MAFSITNNVHSVQNVLDDMEKYIQKEINPSVITKHCHHFFTSTSHCNMLLVTNETDS